MTKEEIEALLIEVDMTPSVKADLWEGEIKLSLPFADKSDPIKVAEMYGKRISNPDSSNISSVLKSLAKSFRKLIDDKRDEGLVPYYDINP